MERRAIAIQGIVQGVGFRPFVYGLACSLHLGGFVKNHTGGVKIEVEGESDLLDQFVARLIASPPPLARIEGWSCESRSPRGDRQFSIDHSEQTSRSGIVITPDAATCDACLTELFDPKDRRYRYPFLNCTNCGPRLTIVLGAPYDRERTTMRQFAMCPDCRREYEDPADRRFHAQPNACPTCGPKLTILEAEGRRIETIDPLAYFVDAMRAGKIGAMKGLGGYHLVCDATNSRAVAELRRRKHRDEKPLAIMVRDLRSAEQLCEVDALSRELIVSPRRPIVLLRKRAAAGLVGSALRTVDSEAGQSIRDGPGNRSWHGFSTRVFREETRVGNPCHEKSAPIAELNLARKRSDCTPLGDSVILRYSEGSTCSSESARSFGVPQDDSRSGSPAVVAHDHLAPGNPFLGVMLPYTPLHHLLLHDMDGVPLVMTSGNRSDEPIAYQEPEAIERLKGIADVFLIHDRPIHVRCDDSVTRAVGGIEAPIRRSRGYAPQPILLPMACPAPLLAVGGQLKATFALGSDRRAIISQHMGDLDHFEAYRAFERDVALYEQLFSLQPQYIAHDLHPDYASTRYARERTGRIANAPGTASPLGDPRLAAPLAGRPFAEGTGLPIDATRPASGAAKQAHPVPSPPYSGERVRVRGDSGDLRDSRRATPGPSPQPSPPSTGEKEQDVPPVVRFAAPRTIAVQHHHAHMASCMAEHGLAGPVIGVTLDGTGFGTDGAIWGGEFLVGDYRQFRRAAHLRYVGMPGGESAVREPWRMAAAHLADAGIVCESFERRIGATSLNPIHKMLNRRFNCPSTSSAGRLFDAVASLAGVRDRVSYEGQAAIELEWLADGQPMAGSYPIEFPEVQQEGNITPPIAIDTRPMIRAIAGEIDASVDKTVIARKFHSTCVEIIALVCRKIRESCGIEDVVLSGGAFMNALLAVEVDQRLKNEGFCPFRHRLVPCNDGGLSLGQLAVAASQLSQA